MFFVGDLILFDSRAGSRSTDDCEDVSDWCNKERRYGVNGR